MEYLVVHEVEVTINQDHERTFVLKKFMKVVGADIRAPVDLSKVLKLFEMPPDLPPDLPGRLGYAILPLSEGSRVKHTSSGNGFHLVICLVSRFVSTLDMSLVKEQSRS